MKFSNEVKVGIIAIVTIVVFIWLFNFMKGQNLLSKDAIYYTVYDKVGGLGESSPVEVNGYRIGVVQSISFISPVSGKLLVEFSVDKDFRIPVNTVAEIVPVSVLGGMKVQFVYGDGPGFYNSRDTIPGKISSSLAEMLETEMLPLKDRISDLIGEIDSVLTTVNTVLDPAFRKNLGNTMANLSSTTGSLSNVLGSKEKELKLTLDNLSAFSAMLSENTVRLGETFENLQSITDTLRSADIYSAVSNLRSTLANTTKMLGSINEGKGSAGQLLTNDSLYTNLSNSLASLDDLLKDLKENPGRYVRFSVFGKKDKPVE
jgi:phospholipid/cholesterol/gamma-HCH transport system substrate-binding protein